MDKCLTCKKPLNECVCTITDEEWVKYRRDWASKNTSIEPVKKPKTKGQFYELLEAFGLNNKGVEKIKKRFMKAGTKAVRNGLHSIVDDMLKDKDDDHINAVKCKKCRVYYPEDDDHECEVKK